MMAVVDEFILIVDMKYTRPGWRNRNQIKTLQVFQTLPVPLKVKGKYIQAIPKTKIDGAR
ncbi:MAG: WbqC family protein [Glaciimonas sp.]|nr:WbqC family protein [Glaciimonas sp.]